MSTPNPGASRNRLIFVLETDSMRKEGNEQGEFFWMWLFSLAVELYCTPLAVLEGGRTVAREYTLLDIAMCRFRNESKKTIEKEDTKLCFIIIFNRLSLELRALVGGHIITERIKKKKDRASSWIPVTTK